jgi:hypothetical protein
MIETRLRRRGLLAATAAIAATPALAQRRYGDDAPPQRYPDPDIVTLDPRRFTAPLGNSRSGASTPACSGPRARPGTRPAAS